LLFLLICLPTMIGIPNRLKAVLMAFRDDDFLFCFLRLHKGERLVVPCQCAKTQSGLARDPIQNEFSTRRQDMTDDQNSATPESPCQIAN
jgi:hypothetical protein